MNSVKRFSLGRHTGHACAALYSGLMRSSVSPFFLEVV